MIRKIIQIGDPILETKTRTVKDFRASSTKKVVADLLDTCISEADRSAGLSANQIGEDISVCICRRTDIEELEKKKGNKEVKLSNNELWEVMINPRVVKSSKGESIFWEGCLSIGVTEKETLYGPVARPSNVEIEYLNTKGETKYLSAKDFFSHIVQHEIDHLNGILFISYVENPTENIWIATELDEYIKREGEYPPIV